MPIEASARLAQHSVEEAKRYSTNCMYELSDITAAPLKLVSERHPSSSPWPHSGFPGHLAAAAAVQLQALLFVLTVHQKLLLLTLCLPCWECAQASPEFSNMKGPLPVPLAAGGSLYGVPYDVELFNTAGSAVPAAAAAAAGAVTAILSSTSMQASVAQVEEFISSYAGRPDLNMLLHEPALKKGSSTVEQLPVKLLREFEGALHLHSPGSGLLDFTSRLPSISAAGLAPPAADRLVRPELAGVYTQLAADIHTLSSRLRGNDADADSAASGCPQLKLHHYSQVTFGRLDLAWQTAVGQQQRTTAAAQQR